MSTMVKIEDPRIRCPSWNVQARGLNFSGQVGKSGLTLFRIETSAHTITDMLGRVYGQPQILTSLGWMKKKLIKIEHFN